MSTDFKLESFVKDGCLIIRTFGYINNVGGKEIVKIFNNAIDKGTTKINNNLS